MGKVGGEWGKVGKGEYPGSIVSDVVSVKMLSTRVEAGLDELMSAELVSMMLRATVRRSGLDGALESIKYADRKSPMLPPSACRRCRGFCIVISLPVRRWKRFRT